MPVMSSGCQSETPLFSFSVFVKGESVLSHLGQILVVTQLYWLGLVRFDSVLMFVTVSSERAS